MSGFRGFLLFGSVPDCVCVTDRGKCQAKVTLPPVLTSPASSTLWCSKQKKKIKKNTKKYIVFSHSNCCAKDENNYSNLYLNRRSLCIFHLMKLTKLSRHFQRNFFFFPRLLFIIIFILVPVTLPTGGKKPPCCDECTHDLLSKH